MHQYTYRDARALMCKINALVLQRDKSRWSGVARLQADNLNVRVFAAGIPDDYACPFFPAVVKMLQGAQGVS